MGDVGDFWRDIKQHRREQKAKYGKDCPGCPEVQPKRIPTRLMPGQRCRVCGYTDPRPTPPEERT